MTSRSTALASKRIAAWVIACAILTLPALASAERRIVVLEFDGPRASQFRREVIRELRDDHQLISQKRFESARDELEDFDDSPEAYAQIAADLDADGIVSGTVDKKGRNFVLTVRVREGFTGAYTVREAKFRGRRARLRGRAARRFRRDLRAAVSELPDRSELAAEKEAEEEEDEPDEEAVAEREPPEDEPEEPEASDAAVSDAVLADRAIRGRAVELSGGLSFTSRRLTFTTAPDIAQDPQGYDGGMVPGLFVEADVYPMAFDEKQGGWLRNIGVTAMVDKVLSIESTLQDRDDVSLSSSQTQWGAGVVYRHNFGDSPTDPSIKASVRYSSLSFSIDRSMVPDGTTIELPDVKYTYIDPGLAVRYPITPEIAASAEGRLFVIRGTGQMQETTAYGGASVTGYAAALGAEYRVTPEIVVEASGKWQRYAFDFAGTGDLADPDGDGTQDVGGAADRYLALYLTAGYVF